MGIRLQLPISLGLLAAYAGTANSASLSLQAEANVPTQQFSPNCHQANAIAETLEWFAFARAAIPDARPMRDWERQDADEFFWSQFQ